MKVQCTLNWASKYAGKFGPIKRGAQLSATPNLTLAVNDKKVVYWKIGPIKQDDQLPRG